ncbi:hypothetical protein [Nocardia salmonicida]|uniref:hypothetical protein n=1 Tax=Nocardia salmonicida TaxID=53431 RepID=UPI0033FBABC1
MNSPGQQPFPRPPVPPRQAPKSPNTRIVWLIGAGVVAVFIALAVVGNLMKSDETPTAATSDPSWPTMPDATSAKLNPTAVAPPTTVPPLQRTATATPSPDFPAGLNPRCAKAPTDLVAAVNAGLKDRNHTLAHAVVLRGGDGFEYLGASIVDPAGLLIQRSDVWVRGRGKVYAASGGARNESTFERASRGLDVDLAGVDFVTADECARAWAKVSGYR